MKICNDNNTTMSYLKEVINDFNMERNWNQSHTPRDLSISICLEAAELLENFQWTSFNSIDDLKKNHKYNDICDEVADVMIYCFCMANALNIDISDAILCKLDKNSTKYPSK